MSEKVNISIDDNYQKSYSPYEVLSICDLLRIF